MDALELDLVGCLTDFLSHETVQFPSHKIKGSHDQQYFIEYVLTEFNPGYQIEPNPIELNQTSRKLNKIKSNGA